MWTADTDAIVHTVGDELNMDVDTDCQGDNMILKPKIVVPDFVPLGAEHDTEFLPILEAQLNSVMA
eukprot:13051386-Heterocapsa_arctica.AAC.1